MAEINVTAIPKEWANTVGWTRSMSSSLTSKESKRPLISPDKASQALTLPSLIEGENPVNPIGLCGFLSSMANDIVVIDIDMDRPRKKFLKESLQNGTMSLQEVQAEALSVLVPTLPGPIKELLTRSYAEFSTSGTGLHIVFKTDKNKFKDLISNGARSRAYWKATDFDGQLSVSNNYMVTTGNMVPGCASELQDVPFAILDACFNITSKRTSAAAPEQVDACEIIDAETLPSIQELERAVLLIPIDQSQRVKTVYHQVTGHQYEHYDFWLHIGMAIHSYAKASGKETQCLNIFIKWSALDQEAFTGDEDVAAKWNSFSQMPMGEGISYKTLFKIAVAFQLNYPKRQIGKEGRLLVNPKRTEYVNFKYLMDKYHLRLFRVGGIDLYLTGDQDILDKYFMLYGVSSMFGYYGPYSPQQLATATWRLCQDSLWLELSSTTNFTNAWIDASTEDIDLFEEWLKQPKESLPFSMQYPRFFDDYPRRVYNRPEFNTFEYLASCIEWDGDETNPDDARRIKLYKRMLKCTMMQLIKLHSSVNNTFTDNGGMFALIGPENTRKTTFFKLLLPVPLEFMRKDVNQELTGEKNKRDFVRNLSTSAIVLVDEFEGFMDNRKSGAFFKSIISGNTTSFTEIYATQETKLKRKAILVGTSNERKQIISDNGSRRLWFAEIRNVDSNKMLNINLYELYNNLRIEFEQEVISGNTPWLLDTEETKEVTAQNKALKAQSSIDIDIREVFAYTTDYDVEHNKYDLATLVPVVSRSVLSMEENNVKARFMKTLQVKKFLEFHGVDVPSSAELERALERFCMTFIGQTSDMISLTSSRGGEAAIIRGRLCINKKKNTNLWNEKFWIVPNEEDNNG